MRLLNPTTLLFINKISIKNLENMLEIWKDISGYDGYYQISNLGRVKSLRFNKSKILKQRLNTAGYLCIGLSNKSKSLRYSIHQLVAIGFLNHKPNGFKLVVDHINNIKTDNRVENLQIITNRENCSKDKKEGTSKYVGVCLYNKNNKWRSKIYINGKRKHLGMFNTELEAHLAYQNALKELNIK